MQQTLFAGSENQARLPGRGMRSGHYTNYRLGSAYDEMFATDGTVRQHYAELYDRVSELTTDELRRRQQACEQSFLHQGITFTVYGENQSTERIIPTDLLPRIITASEWNRVEGGLKQRIAA